MSKITLRLPWPPTVNHYWVRTRRGVVIGEAGLKFRIDVMAIVLSRFGIISPSHDRMRVHIVAVAKDRRRRDIDNLPKATLDALSHAKIWDDDYQVDDLRIVRGHVESPGWLDVEIETIPAVGATND